jgi:hypothetical protein
MPIRLPTSLLVVCAAILAASCGGGGSGGGDMDASPSPLTGVFVGGPVQGMRYRTPTRSGFTSIAGEFSYLPGEVVTFSVGAVHLGVAPGSARISPFEFFNLTPPATASALRAELSRYDDVSNFDRAANIALFLMSLDSDSNPGNGIDISEWEARLATAALSFDAPMYAFATGSFLVFAKQYGVNRNVPLDLPLTHLYGALAIAIPTQALVMESVTNGSASASYARSYDIAGRLDTYKADGDVDGTSDRQQRYTYDGQGRVQSEVREVNDDDSGPPELVTSITYTYDLAGNQIRVLRTTDASVAGVPDQGEVTVRHFDSAGNLVATEVESDTGNDGTIDVRVAMAATYNSSGQSLVETQRTTNASGKSSRTASYTYDTAGREIARVVDLDSNGDDVADRRATFSNTYDPATGLLASAVILTDNDLSAVSPIMRSETIHTYYPSGRELTRRVVPDSDGNGVLDSTQESGYVYDAAGHETLRIIASDADADGALDRREKTTRTFDAAGNTLSDTTETDADGSGAFDARIVRVKTYNSGGDILTDVTEQDSNADAVIDSRIVYTAGYDANGNILTLRSQADATGDGIFENEYLTTYAYSELIDGLDYLLRKYLGVAPSVGEAT